MWKGQQQTPPPVGHVALGSPTENTCKTAFSCLQTYFWCPGERCQHPHLNLSQLSSGGWLSVPLPSAE